MIQPTSTARRAPIFHDMKQLSRDTNPDMPAFRIALRLNEHHMGHFAVLSNCDNIHATICSDG